MRYIVWIWTTCSIVCFPAKIEWIYIATGIYLCTYTYIHLSDSRPYLSFCFLSVSMCLKYLWIGPLDGEWTVQTFRYYHLFLPSLFVYRHLLSILRDRRVEKDWRFQAECECPMIYQIWHSGIGAEETIFSCTGMAFKTTNTVDRLPGCQTGRKKVIYWVGHWRIYLWAEILAGEVLKPGFLTGFFFLNLDMIFNLCIIRCLEYASFFLPVNILPSP